ncbi:MAG: hypothetical protein DYG92_06645 [Leptolyngbya sp. PLA1]|nr:hypothetical protein [Leptolyngbya sp. PLA1]
MCLFLTAVGLAPAQPLVRDLGLVPGDRSVLPATNSQSDLAIARGGDAYLAVWTDGRGRSSGSQTNQSDSDLFGIRVDASGNPLDPAPFLIAGGMGYQRRPKVAWNGEHWLVVFESQEPTQPPVTYFETRVRFVRVSAEGRPIDTVPFSLPPTQFEPDTIGLTVSGLGGNWLVARCVYHNDGYGTFLAGQRITSAGQLLDPAPVMLNDWVYGQLQVVATASEYMVIGPDWNDGALLKARRIGANLQPLAPSFNLPTNAYAVGSNGSELYITWIQNFTDIVGSRMTSAGTLLNPAGTPLFPNFSGELDIAHDGVNWWLSRTVSNEARLLRVSPAGTRLDALGGVPLPIVVTGSVNSLYDSLMVPRAGGGVLYGWTDLRQANGNDQNAFVMPVAPSNSGESEHCLSTGTRSQRSSAVTRGPGGSLALAFVSEAANDDRVLLHLLDPAGNPATTEPVEVAQAPTIGVCGIAWNGANYLLTWDQGGPGVTPTGVVARLLNADGTFAGPTFSVMPGMNPSVEALNGRFCIAATRFATNPQFIDLWIKRLDAQGAALDPANGIAVSGGYHSGLTRTRTDGSQWLVASHSQWTHDSSQSDAVIARVPFSGTPSTGFNPTPFSGGSGDPDVAFSGSRFLIVWRNNSLSNANNYVAGRLMNPDGSYGPSFTIAEAPGRQLRPTVVWDGVSFLVAWDDQRRQSQFYDERTDVYAARVSEGGTLMDPAALPVVTGAEGDASPAFVGINGGALVATTRFSTTAGFDSYRIGLTRIGGPSCDPDLNHDGNADQDDATYLVDVVGGGPNPTGIDPDFNHDGNVDQDDLAALINVLAGGACP